MSKKKIVTAITAGAVILAGISTTAFAMDGGLKEGLKAAKENLKQNIVSFQSKKGTVKSALEEKYLEAGFVKIDKESAESQLEALKSIKDDIQEIRGEISAAKADNDSEKAAGLRAQLIDKASQANKAAEALTPFKEQIKANRAVKAKLAPLKEQLLAIKEEMYSIHEQNASIRNEILKLREQLKAAPKENAEELSNIANEIMEKLNLLNNNFTNLNALKEKAANMVKDYKL
jgi:chromosome segregation ATPase